MLSLQWRVYCSYTNMFDNFCILMFFVEVCNIKRNQNSLGRRGPAVLIWFPFKKSWWKNTENFLAKRIGKNLRKKIEIYFECSGVHLCSWHLKLILGSEYFKLKYSCPEASRVALPTGWRGLKEVIFWVKIFVCFFRGQNASSGCYRNRAGLIFVRSQNFLKNWNKKRKEDGKIIKNHFYILV